VSGGVKSGLQVVCFPHPVELPAYVCRADMQACVHTKIIFVSECVRACVRVRACIFTRCASLGDARGAVTGRGAFAMQ